MADRHQIRWAVRVVAPRLARANSRPTRIAPAEPSSSRPPFCGATKIISFYASINSNRFGEVAELPTGNMSEKLQGRNGGGGQLVNVKLTVSLETQVKSATYVMRKFWANI
jgi:hypothetical protein